MNREIELLFKAVHDKLDHYQHDNKESLSKIVEQTTKHNGRMAKIEDTQATQKGFIKAIFICIGVVIPICTSVLSWALYEIISIPKKIHDTIATYDVELK